MNAADTSASSAIADCTPLTVVFRSWTTDEIDTFINDVSTTSTNIAMDRRIASARLCLASWGAATVPAATSTLATCDAAGGGFVSGLSWVKARSRQQAGCVFKLPVHRTLLLLLG